MPATISIVLNATVYLVFLGNPLPVTEITSPILIVAGVTGLIVIELDNVEIHFTFL